LLQEAVRECLSDWLQFEEIETRTLAESQPRFGANRPSGRLSVGVLHVEHSLPQPLKTPDFAFGVSAERAAAEDASGFLFA
jgi:hypothetical protein